KTYLCKVCNPFPIHQVANCAIVVSETASVNARLESKCVFVRQKVNPVTRAAKSKYRLLDAPKVPLEDAWQRKKFLRPVPSNRFAVHETQPAVHPRVQFVPDQRANYFGFYRVSILNIGIEGIPVIGQVLNSLEVVLRFSKE